MAGLNACDRTLRRTMSSAGYHHHVARKKPFLSNKTRVVGIPTSPSFSKFSFFLFFFFLPIIEFFPVSGYSTFRYRVWQELVEQLSKVSQPNISLSILVDMVLTFYYYRVFHGIASLQHTETAHTRNSCPITVLWVFSLSRELASP